jgi:lysozyme family protein
MKSQKWIKAFNKTMKHEGGFVNHLSDPGGATKYGISLRFLKNNEIDINEDGNFDIFDIEALELRNATDIYYTYFWKKYRCDEIDSDKIAAKYFDCCVNMGGRQAGRILQRSVNTIDNNKLKVDGITGFLTISAVNNLIEPNQQKQLLKAIKKQCVNFYELIVKQNPKLKVFKRGWIRRAVS